MSCRYGLATRDRFTWVQNIWRGLRYAAPMRLVVRLVFGVALLAGISLGWPHLMKASAEFVWPDGWDPDRDAGVYIFDALGERPVEFFVGPQSTAVRRDWSGPSGRLWIETHFDGGRSQHTRSTNTTDQVWLPSDVMGFEIVEEFVLRHDSPYHGQLAYHVVGPPELGLFASERRTLFVCVHHQLSVEWRQVEGALELQLLAHDLADLDSLEGRVQWIGQLIHFRFMRRGDRLIATVPLHGNEGVGTMRAQVNLNAKSGPIDQEVVITLTSPDRLERLKGAVRDPASSGR